MKTDTDLFFEVPFDAQQEARMLASEVICRLLLWMADGRSIEERGLRVCVALYCVRPDLLDHATLGQIGDNLGRTRQAVHKLAISFRETTQITA
ncbi:hypothetical protein CMV30_03715 [Nibricoccus aquaticus]|uniref:Uncharacterized protein n=1 Tax=Nibricoccus aquaticus TaxID=2576891 RepID=A0A290Q3X5_9BACT|nr:hypothetical protein [Nibricoccus aquaticus]ATC63133.1 hypothetical protein CMV30_03715 [Nibricoccus aquaticus]